MSAHPTEEALAVRPRGPGGDGQSGGRDSLLTLYRITEPPPPVSLRAPYLVYYGVVEGEKTVVSDEGGAHTLHAGESLLVPPLRSVHAEFPNADRSPVRWLVHRIDRETVEAILDRLEPVTPSGKEQPHWDLREQPFCPVPAREGLRRTLDHVAFLFREEPPHRDALLDLSVRQLLTYLVQTRAYSLLVNGLSRHSAEGGIAAAVQYIQNHLDRHISIDELVERACMSKSTFYRHFNDEFDMSPLEYITKQRVVRARHLLSTTDRTVADVSRALGFSSTSYFIDMFREHVGQTPKQYQLRGTESSSSETGTG